MRKLIFFLLLTIISLIICIVFITLRRPDEADYVIVGAGTAGSVLAARLIQNGDSVIIIEAGSNHMKDPNVRLAKNYTNYWNTPNIPQETLWGYNVQRDNCLSTMYYPIAHMLGGCTSHHGMINNIGHPQTYDEWATFLNDPSWKYDNLLRLLKRMEHCNDPDADPKYHGFDGWLQLTKNPSNEINDTLLDVALQYYNYIPDFAAPNVPINGVGRLYSQFSFNEKGEGIRSYAAGDLLHPVLKKNNSKIIYNSFVNRLLFEDNKVIGVEYVKGKHLYEADPMLNVAKSERYKLNSHQIRARKEVILCTGSIHSPQLLMLNGIGPRDQLEKFGIKVLKESPGVGQHLGDHIEINMIHKVNYQPNLKQATGTGIDLNVMSGLKIPEYTMPDIHLSCFNGYFQDFNIASWEKCYDKNQQYVTFEVQTTHPASHKGFIQLVSDDPLDVPIINQNLIGPDAEYDFNTIVVGVGIIRKFFKDQKMQKYNPVEVFPGLEYNTDEKLLDFIKKNCHGHHLSGTCRMGPENDDYSPLDSQMKVKGIEGLRVCDASVFPFITGGNPSLTVYLCGEMLAEILTK